jgi:hypothetical protein
VLDEARITRAAGIAHGTLAERDTGRALQQLTALTDSLCPPCTVELLLRARLEASRGRDREAAALLDRWSLGGWGLDPIEIVTVLERGHIAEPLGDRALAIEKYQYVADIWRRAHPELQTFVEDAKDGLARLTREPR